MVKDPPANARDTEDLGSIPGSGRSAEGGNGNPLQYSCLENAMNRGAGGLQSMGGKESDMIEATEHATYHQHFKRRRLLEYPYLTVFIKTQVIRLCKVLELLIIF